MLTQRVGLRLTIGVGTPEALDAGVFYVLISASGRTEQWVKPAMHACTALLGVLQLARWESAASSSR